MVTQDTCGHREATAESQEQPAQAPVTKTKARRVREKPGRELTSDQAAERDRISDALQEAHDKLENAVSAYNSALDDLKAPVEQALEELNNALSDARDLRDGIVGDADEYMGERSERWQESDAAQAVSGYKSEWEYAELEDGQIEFPDELEMPDVDPEVLANLPESAEL